MSGRIYDSGVNPICDICGSKMYTSSEMNFYGCVCKKSGCKGYPIYDDVVNLSPKLSIDKKGKYILHGVFTILKSGNLINKQRFNDYCKSLKEKFKKIKK